MIFDTLSVNREGAFLFVEIAAPPMNLLGPELGRARALEVMLSAEDYDAD